MPTVAPLDLDGHCLAAAFIADVPHFALADGSVHRLDNGHKTIEPHDGLISTAVTPDAGALLTGGEDGKVCLIRPGGAFETLSENGSKWITAVACGPSGTFAWSIGRTATVRLPEGDQKTFEEQRSIEALAFAPKGIRLACARYNGVSLYWAATAAKPLDLEWKGAHTGVTFSPNGNYLVTTMQENALHGWRLADERHMRMAGYPSKVKSVSWSTKGKWLATSGAPAAIVWPFTGKDGPMGKAPAELGTRGDQLVTCVAFHPEGEVVAIGYGDGMILAARMADSKEVLLRRAGKGAITAMTWDKAGRRLVFGSAEGDCGVVDITA